MKLSDNGKRLLAEWEGEILHVYRDAAGLPTIGIGHLLTKSELSTNTIRINGVVVPLGNITDQQALDLLGQDVEPAEACVNTRVTVPITQSQFDALVIFAFNIGTGGFSSSSALTDINNGNLDNVPNDLMKWDKITDPQTKQHVLSAGLVNRRQKEIDLWNSQTA